MEFAEPLSEGLLERRYKRFFADIITPGGLITAHVPNTGSLRGCLSEKAPCLYSTVNDPKRKLPHTLQMVSHQGAWVGVNTGLANHLAWEAYETRQVKHWLAFDQGQREVKISSESRLDMAFWNSQNPGKKHFVEVKSVTLKEDGKALFPDSVTTRGLKHLIDLQRLIEEGNTSEIFFLIQRADCTVFSPAAHIDPDYAAELKNSLELGVRVSAFACELNKNGIRFCPNPISIEI